MKTVRSIFLLAVATLILCSCVSRTVSASSVDSSGKESDGKVVEKKIIWIWQDEFRNP